MEPSQTASVRAAHPTSMYCKPGGELRELCELCAALGRAVSVGIATSNNKRVLRMR